MEPESDAEVSRQVAIACGWVDDRDPYGEMHFMRPPGADAPARCDFATSLDACFAPGGPVEYAKAQGWRYQLVAWDGYHEARFLKLDTASGYIAVGFGHTPLDHPPARALCLAFLSAVKSDSQTAKIPRPN